MIFINNAAINKRKLRPFHSATREDFSMYNKMPYFRDTDLCTADTIQLVTGNVIKYFQYSLKDTAPLSDMDILAMVKIQEYQEKEIERLAALSAVNDENETEDISVTLSEDSSQETPAKERPAYLDMDYE